MHGMVDQRNGPSSLPADFRLDLDPSARVERDGRVVLGGWPFRIVLLDDEHATAMAAWSAGDLIGDDPRRRRFARALVAANLAHPRPPAQVRQPADVAVVVPVRDRPRQLRRLLRALAELPDADQVREVVVVDDASEDPAATARIADAGRARLVRRHICGGAPAARNTGAAATDRLLIAFLDSDCVPQQGWLTAGLPHFADPLVALVAPRIVALAAPDRGWVATYEHARSPLDRGPRPGRVVPGGQVPFVPGAAMIVRRAAFEGGFDETLRGGEDVDLVRRLTAKGWHVRYEPDGRVGHEHRTSVRGWLARRAYYGRTAAPLATRHPAAARPLAVSPWTAAAWAAAVLRRPVLATGIVGTACALLAGELSGVVDQPLREAARLAGGGTLWSGLHVADALSRIWWPATLAAAALVPRLRLPVAAAALVPPLLEWDRLGPPLDPVRWAIARVLDDAAYGWGVWEGCWAHREWGPLRPDLSWRLTIETGDELVARVA
jgi:mycofactocin system glycosyltransferase